MNKYFVHYSENINQNNSDPRTWQTISFDKYTELYKDELPIENSDIVEINLHDAKLENAKKIIKDLPNKNGDKITIYYSFLEAFHALEIQLDSVIMKALLRNEVDEEWATEYIDDLSIKSKLDSALRIHLGYDITEEPFYNDLKNIIKQKNQLSQESSLLSESNIIFIIKTIELAINAINKKSTDLD